MPRPRDPKSRFWRIATAGIFFQGGAAAVDTSTIIASLVDALTGSPFAVGAAAAISRYGWLFPQLFVAYFAQRRHRRLPLYILGAFGRAACLAGVAGVVALATGLSEAVSIAAFFALWTVYAFVSGIVAVPYYDIVARSVPSAGRSRLLATRFFGGGVLALGVAAAAHSLLDSLTFPGGHAAILLLGASLLLTSALFFVSAGETEAPLARGAANFGAFVKEGVGVWRADTRFRLFVYARWLDGAAAMALPFYVLQVTTARGSAADVAVLLGAQSVGALLSNPLWGWWGDRRGKQPLLEGVAGLGLLAPSLTLAWIWTGASSPGLLLPCFAIVFFVLGAVGNGGTIAQLGYLMEISPDERRPAYSGYFNALVAPAALSPVAGAAVVAAVSPAMVFAASVAAAALQFLAVRRLREPHRRREDA